MLSLTARCPNCDQSFRLALVTGEPVICPLCQQQLNAACPDLAHAATVERCLTCPSRELFIRKDFPQRLGVAIVVSGFAASIWAWYHHRVILTFAILFATALVDVILYVVMGNLLECYRCHAQYRGLPSLEGHEGFELEVHERYRQQAARLQESKLQQSPVNTSANVPQDNVPPANAPPANAPSTTSPASHPSSES